MKKKEYMTPESREVQIATNVNLLTVSAGNQFELGVNDPTITVGGDEALTRMFDMMGINLGVPDL